MYLLSHRETIMWPVSAQAFDKCQSNADKLILMELGRAQEYSDINGTYSIFATNRPKRNITKHIKLLIIHSNIFCNLYATLDVTSCFISHQSFRWKPILQSISNDVDVGFGLWNGSGYFSFYKVIPPSIVESARNN